MRRRALCKAIEEKVLLRKRINASMIIQKNWRCYTARKKYLQMVEAATTLQRAWRTHFHLKQMRAAVKIQSHWWKHVARKTYLQKVTAIVCLQTHWRRCLAERELNKLRVRHQEHLLVRANVAAAVIQMSYRRYLCQFCSSVVM